MRLKANLKSGINVIKTNGVLWQLFAYILRTDKYALKMRPGPLNFKPDVDHLICSGEFFLPCCHFFQEMSNIL